MAARFAKIPVVRTVRALRKKVDGWRLAGESVALVPTMGALHEGHLSLVRLAQKKCDHVVVSIFVNPTQFGVGEDFGSYPRSEETDREKLAPLKADVIYAPTVSEMYGEAPSTNVHVAGVSDGLCGASRPDHFDGVATVVSKLLLQVNPHIAIFGEKDFQQLLVIKQLTRDLNIPVKILGEAIVREKDGLALSSRNAYLSAREREIAPKLQQVMKQAAAALKSGRQVKAVIASAAKKLEKAGFRIDYLEVRHSETLVPVIGKVKPPARLFAAVYLRKTRLIDNLKI